MAQGMFQGEWLDSFRDVLALRDNTYPGRIAMMGISVEGDMAIQAYAIMGRSAGSRSRIFLDEGVGSIRTIAPGKSQEEMDATENAELIYYQASIAGEGVFVISNGAQTPYVHKSIVNGSDLESAVRDAPVVDGVDLSKFEPDEPNFTPRITGVIDLRDPAPTPFGLAVVRRNPASGEPEYEIYETGNIRDIPAGMGFGVQTYLRDGTPLPSFDREPFAFPFDEDALTTAQSIWNVLNTDNRVALMTRTINLATSQIEETCIINSPAK